MVACPGLLIGGLALVVPGAELLIGSIKVICTRHHLPPAVIAVTFVALAIFLGVSGSE